jgi:CAAD domains of cyanobacterial aminoacyl-tRNA synthetase
MNPESKPNDVSQAPKGLGIETEGGSLSSSSSSDAMNVNVQEIKTQVLSVLSDFFTYAGKFFEEYQKPITNVGLIVAVLIAFYLVIAVIDAVNDLPLLAPLFELIGIGYTIWFVKQYWSAEAREKLWAEVKAFTSQVVGKN